MYDTVRAALLALTDDTLFERVAVKVLRLRHPGLRITGPSGDLNRDAFSRPPFGERDEIVLLVSCEARWTAKLRRDLEEYRPYPAKSRPKKAIFVTNRSTKQTTQVTYKKRARELGIKLEVVDLNELVVELESDSLHRVAEYDLGVRPRKPRVLQPVAVFREQQEALLPDFSTRLRGRDPEIGKLRDALAQAQRPGGARVVVIEGPAGVGKSRLAVDGSHAVATTLVAVPGTAVTVDSVTDVPLGSPSIVVADDAHRSPDLSGLAAMIGDPRFGRVTIVLTVAAGSAAGVLTRWGLDRARPVIIPLGGLASQEIGEIVAGHGFNVEAFKSHVIEVSQGSPGLAHAACLIAAERKIYRWSDTADLLGQLAEQRLRQAGFDSDEHRAAAVALALLTTVSEGGQLAALAGAVTALPRDVGRLDSLLADLVQAGIAAGPPYVISPAIAPVLVAEALNPLARVKVNLRPVLKALGHGAVTVPADGAAPSNYSVLDIGPLSHSDSGRAAVIDADLLAARLSVLAQASHLREVPGMLGTLQEAVRELLPDEADVVTWLDVLTVAVPVAAAAPKLAGDLRDALARNWPPAAAPSLWNNDPVRQYRSDIDRLVKQAIIVGQRTSHSDVNRAVGWMLECAWLSEPVLRVASIGLARQAIQSILRTRVQSAAQTWDDIFQHRQQVLDAVHRWGRERSAGPPAELPAADREARDPAVAVHVQLGALTPLLSFVTEEHGFRRPGTGTVFLWSHQVLPEDERATAILSSAASAVAGLLNQLDPQSPEARSALETIVRLPREIRAEAARGLGHGQPLPAYATEAMNQAATRISDAVASHWSLLPLAIRYAAAASAARPGGRPGRPLTELAAEGDLLAAAAIADPALTQLLTILPIAQPLSQRTGLTAARQETDTLRRRAQELAETLPTSEAVDLLTMIDYAIASSHHFDCLAVFAHAVGRNAADPEPILSRLLTGDFPAASYILSGLLETRPQPCLAWLQAHISARHVASLALRVADELPAEQETILLDAITTRLAGMHGTRATGTGTRQAISGDALGTGDENPGEPEAAHADLAVEVADHLGRCRAEPAGKLARLVTLSDATPNNALPRILAAVDTILSTPPGTQILDGEDNGVLRQNLAAILTRALASANSVLGTEVDDDTATAATSLGRAAPAEIARILIDRTLQAAIPVIPYPWEGMLLQTPPEEREPLATAYQEGIQPHLGSLPAQTETAALDVLDVLGRDSPGWAALIREWAGGNAADRTRAAIAIRHRWPDPIWRELVPELLDAGISEHSITNLRQGIIPYNDAVDAVSLANRLEVLRPLLDDTRPVVRQFADETAHDLRILLTIFKDGQN